MKLDKKALMIIRQRQAEGVKQPQVTKELASLGYKSSTGRDMTIHIVSKFAGAHGAQWKRRRSGRPKPRTEAPAPKESKLNVLEDILTSNLGNKTNIKVIESLFAR